MKKRPLSRTRSSDRLTGGSASPWIIFLLTLLVVITALDLYLDHFSADREAQPEESQSMKEETTQEQQASVIAVEPEPEPSKPPAEERAVTEPLKPASPSEIKVQVLNGCGVRGIAAKFRGILRDRGFDVMSYGNAGRQDYPKSRIIVRSAGSFGEGAAQVLAESLGIASEHILVEPDPSLVDIDVTLILGLDYKQLKQ